MSIKWALGLSLTGHVAVLGMCGGLYSGLHKPVPYTMEKAMDKLAGQTVMTMSFIDMPEPVSASTGAVAQLAKISRDPVLTATHGAGVSPNSLTSVAQIPVTATASVMERATQEMAGLAASGGVQQDCEAEPLPDAIHNQAPIYPIQARRRGWEGVVLVAVAVSSGGVVTDISVEKSSGYDILDQAALKAIRLWHFVPAQHHGRYFESWLRIPVRFVLKDQKS